jgi:hypothetical protein
MKKQLILFILLCLFEGIQAQTTRVYGNLGVENVNISVIGSKQGTVSDKKGNYTIVLTERNSRINLLYSCIGYQDTVVGLTPRMLERDSVNISFKMRKQDYTLKEVDVLAERPHFEGDRNIIMDFEVYDGIICMLQGNANKYRLLLADEDIIVFDTIPIPKGIKPNLLLKDCMGNCQLVASDSVYQIDLRDKTSPFLATEIHRYYAVMGNCLFLKDKYLYLKKNTMSGFSAMFYRIDVGTKQMQPLFVNERSDVFEDLIDEMDFAASNLPEHGPSLEDWERVVRIMWFRDSSAHLALADYKLVYFDNDNGMIRQYDLKLNELRSCPIDYPQKSDWKPRIFQDESNNRFYTFIGYWLHEIDINTGATTPKTRMNVDVLSKVSLWNNHLYILKRQQTSTNKLRSYIERVDF